MVKFLRWLFLGGSDPRSTRRAKKLTSLEISRIKSGWQEIEKLVQLGGPSNMRQAVIKADKLLEYALINQTGQDTLAAALKLSQKEFSSYEVYDDTWKAHKLRNMVVHDLDHEPGYASLKRAVERFRVALEEVVGGL